MNEILSASQPLFVGRDQEADALRQALLSAFQGQGRLVLIGGEAGIGKTTLVRWLSKLAESLGSRVLTGQCYDLETTPPYGPWIEILRAYEAGEFLPPPPAELVDAAAFERLNSAAELYDVTGSFILKVAEDQPVMIVLEDQHWADQASLDLLRYLARRISTSPILIVVTYRDVELTPQQPLYRLLPHLVRESPAERVPLPRLDQNAIRDLVNERYELKPDESARLVAYLQRYAEGNPFFSEELLVTLEHNDSLRRAPKNGHWTLADLSDIKVPPLVRQIISDQLFRIGEDVRQPLQVAAVIGLELPLDLWRDVAEVSDDDLTDIIDRALQARLLVESGAVGRLSFRHALIREALYESLILPRRREWHRRVGEAFARHPNPDPDIVAHHFRQAGDDQRAVDWLVRAGRRATLAFAYQTAARRYEQALEILERDDSRLSERTWMYCYIAESYRYTDTQRAFKYVNRARDLLDIVDDPALRAIILRTRSHMRGMLGENALDEIDAAVTAFESLSDEDRQRIFDSPLGYTVSKATYAQRLAYYGQYEKSRRLADEFLHEAGASATHPDEYGLAWLTIGMASAGLGEPERARQAYATARAYFDEVDNSYQTGLAYAWEYTTTLHVYYADLPEERRRYIRLADEAFQKSVYAAISDDEQALILFMAHMLDGDLEETRSAAAALLGTDSMRIECGAIVAEIDRWQGKTIQSLALIKRTLPSAPDMDPSTPYYRETLDLLRIAAELLLDAGDLEEAARWIDAHQRWLDWSEMICGRAIPHLLWSRYHRLAGDLPLAHKHAKRALERAIEPRQPLSLVAAHRALGLLYLKENDVDAATEHLQTSLTLAESCQAPFELGLSQLAIAELLGSTGQLDEARNMLDEVRAASEMLGLGLLLQQIDILEQQIERSGKSDEISPYGLSPREIEVLRLVIDGLTDREIGERLYISPRTAGNHVANILNKLGVNSRAAAAAEAVRRGLV